MRGKNKSLYLQIRVSPEEKKAISRNAKNAGMGISQWVLNKAIPPPQQKFQELLGQIQNSSNPKNILAEIHDLLNEAAADEFEQMVSQPPPTSLSHFHLNYIAAMVEYAAAQKGRKAPPWSKDIAPLEKPVFGCNLESLKLYLLTHSPVPFRKRNLFVDSTIGGRV